MGEHDVEAFECHFDCFAVLCAEQVDVVSDYVGLFVESEDGCGIAWVRQIGEDVADLSPDIIGIGLEQLEEFFY